MKLREMIPLELYKELKLLAINGELTLRHIEEIKMFYK